MPSFAPSGPGLAPPRGGLAPLRFAMRRPAASPSHWFRVAVRRKVAARGTARRGRIRRRGAALMRPGIPRVNKPSEDGRRGRAEEHLGAGREPTRAGPAIAEGGGRVRPPITGHLAQGVTEIREKPARAVLERDPGKLETRETGAAPDTPSAARSERLIRLVLTSVVAEILHGTDAGNIGVVRGAEVGRRESRLRSGVEVGSAVEDTGTDSPSDAGANAAGREEVNPPADEGSTNGSEGMTGQNPDNRVVVRQAAARDFLPPDGTP